MIVERYSSVIRSVAFEFDISVNSKIARGSFPTRNPVIC